MDSSVGEGSGVLPRRARSLAADLSAALGDRIREGRLAPGARLPTESALMVEFGVSRTVVREGLSKLQAAGPVDPGFEKTIFKLRSFS